MLNTFIAFVIRNGIRRPRLPRWVAGWTLAAVCVPILAATPKASGLATVGQAKEGPKTDFLPSHDEVSLQNRTKGTGTAMDGMCNGYEEMAQAYFQWRSQNPRSVGPDGTIRETPSLAEFTADIKQRYGPQYLADLMNIAANHSHQRKRSPYHWERGYDDPAGLADDVAAQMSAAKLPTVMVMEADYKAHTISAYKAYQADGRWIFQVADSKLIETDDVDRATLTYVPGKNGARGYWLEQAGLREIARYRGGDLVPRPPAVIAPDQRKYLAILEMGARHTGTMEIRGTLGIDDTPSPSAGTGVKPGGVVVVDDPKAGGVLIQFDPGLFSGGASDAELSHLDEEVKAAYARKEPGAVILTARPRKETLTVVPLRSLSADAKTLGTLTRVRGFVSHANGDVDVVGLEEQGAPAIPLDHLTVALRAIYRAGMTPFVSLDPNSDDIGGPQKVRVGQMPSGLRDTAFVRDLLDADYAMKRINLGKDDPGVPGFKRHVDLVRESEGAAAASTNRFWFMPLPDSPGEVISLQRGDDLAVLFESRVQLLTEQMKVGRATGEASAPSDATAEAAAAMITRFFPELETKVPEFRRLHAAFDVAKLCAALRAFNVRSDVLDRLCDRTPAAVPLKEAYEGIGPEALEGTSYVVSGGVQTSVRVSKKTAIQPSQLSVLLDAGGKAGNVDLELPDAIVIPESALASVEDGVDFAQALKSMENRQYADAVTSLGNVLKDDPDNDDALVLRAVAHDALKRSKEAIADIAEACKRTPWLVALRGLFEARAGDRDAALKDADDAAQAYSDDETVRFVNVTTRMLTLDLDGADRELRALRELCPTNPMSKTYALGVATLRRLGPAGAARRLRLMRELPPEIGAAIGVIPAGDGAQFGDSLARLEEALQTCLHAEATLPADLYVVDRCRIGLASLYSARAGRKDRNADAYAKRAEELLDQTIAAHPTWPTAYCLRALAAATRGKPATEVARLYGEAVERIANEDPLADDLCAGLHTDGVIQLMGVLMWAMLEERNDDGGPILGAAIPVMKKPEEAAMLRAVLAEKRVNVSSALAHSRPADPAMTPAAFLEILDTLTAKIPPALGGSDPTYLFAVEASTLSLALHDRTHTKEGFQDAADRTLRLAQATDMPPSELPVVAQCRSTSWFTVAVQVLTDATDAGAPAAEPTQKVMALLQRCADGTEPGADAEVARKALVEAKARFDEMATGVGMALTPKLDAARAKYGNLTADILELGAAVMGRATTALVTRAAAKIRDRYPDLAAAPELQAMLDYGVKAGWMVPETPEQIWRRVSAGVECKVNAEALVKYVQAMAGFLEEPEGVAPAGADLKALIARMQAEMRLKSGMLF